MVSTNVHAGDVGHIYYGNTALHAGNDLHVTFNNGKFTSTDNVDQTLFITILHSRT